MALPKEISLESTATWAVAVVCFVLVAISIVIEQLIHHAELWLKKKRKLPLYEALGKIKAGRGATYFSIRDTPAAYLHFCIGTCSCNLLCSHLRLWKIKDEAVESVEDETKTVEYQYYNDPERFRFTRETSFGRRHLHFWSRSPILLWIVCFFRQFFPSVAKVDYLTLRHGFITEHLPPQVQESFDFQKYINRALEEDFKVIVGISPALWFCAVLLLLTNTNGWYSHFWLPFIPLIIILLVGAKLQVIITKMGTRILERGDVVMGNPLVQPNDDLFWFRRPNFILFLIHFENAFQIALFAWSWLKFGYPSCYHKNLEDLLIRIMMGVVIQILCSYVTLPLYALVTQMGSNMKPVIFADDVASRLRDWHATAKKHAKDGRPSTSASPFHGGTPPINLRNDHKMSTHEWGGGEEGASAFPNHHDVHGKKDQLSEISIVEIERNVENSYL